MQINMHLFYIISTLILKYKCNFVTNFFIERHYSKKFLKQINYLSKN